MMFSDTYRMMDAPSEYVHKAKGSRFLAFAFPVRNEGAIKEKLNELRQKYPDATHHCYAWVLGADRQNFRSNDDGEPSGTAGKPILREINRLELCNLLLVVVRYFGGTMLGVPGLIEAYGVAAAQCLAAGRVSEHTLHEVYRVQCAFGSENEVFRICRQFQARISVLQDEACFSAEIKIPLRQAAAFTNAMKLLYTTETEYLGTE